MVVWLIGLSASGKTTIGTKLFQRLQDSAEKWIFLDGDTFRNIFGEDLGHTLEDRKKNAYRISRFCEYMSSQGVNVLACVLSIFHENQKYNKENISDYKEVFIDVSFENLLQRDNKELYKNALEGKIKNVVGVDIEFKPPFSPDLVIENNISNPNYEDISNRIINSLGIAVSQRYSYTNNNLLQTPHKYQYSKFEGELFFIKIKASREEGVSFLQNRLKRLGIQKVHLKQYDSFKKDKSIILKRFLLTLYLAKDSELSKQLATIESLIQRFEVSKKLYLSYDLIEFRKTTAEHNELLNYALFSLVLQRYYNATESEKKFIYLNAILKLNDIILSIKSDFITQAEVYYAKVALDGELKIIEELI